MIGNDKENFLKRFRPIGRSQTHKNDLKAFVFKLCFRAMQLHRLLTEKWSTEVSEKNKKQGAFLP